MGFKAGTDEGQIYDKRRIRRTYMQAGLMIIKISCYLLGALVCIRGMKTKNILYKGGLYFFTLMLMEKIYTIILQLNYDRIVQLFNKIELNIGYWIMLVTVPSSLLHIAAIAILVIYLIKGLNANSNL